MKTAIYHTNDEDETFKLGKELAKELVQGDIVAFYGDLGAGKTEFIKGICEALKTEQLVTSPTFNIMNKYDYQSHGSKNSIYHIDLYRIKDKEELSDIGFNECIFSNDSIKLIEWAENSEGNLPKSRINVSIKNDPENQDKRIIKIDNLEETLAV